jgi:hypothetical protein
MKVGWSGLVGCVRAMPDVYHISQLHHPPQHRTHTHTQDNILTNFPSSDGLMLLGRTGLGATLFFSLPILILPMREVLLVFVFVFLS